MKGTSITEIIAIRRIQAMQNLEAYKKATKTQRPPSKQRKLT